MNLTSTKAKQFVVEALLSLGGTAKTNEVYREIVRLHREVRKDPDFKFKTRFARLSLRTQGFVSSSARGVWRLDRRRSLRKLQLV
jgi:hypothetical protein